MEIYDLDVVSRCTGQTLTPQEYSNLEIGLTKRQAMEPFDTIRFWGRINGEEQDYLIIVGILPGQDYPMKKFFFCTNSSPELQQFPDLSITKQQAIQKLTSRLKGIPDFVLITADELGANNNSEAGPNNNVTELDRLVYIVKEIDNCTTIIPVEAYVASPMRQIVRNPSFHGLKWHNAMSIDNYLHFNEPTSSKKANNLKDSEGLVRPEDLFDSISCDLDGSWVIAKDCSRGYVIAKNLIYFGSFFFHKPETAQYGSVYFGDGRKNADIAFMI